MVSQSAQLPSSRGREIVRARGDTGRLSATRVDVLDAKPCSGLSTITGSLEVLVSSETSAGKSGVSGIGVVPQKSSVASKSVGSAWITVESFSALEGVLVQPSTDTMGILEGVSG